MAIENFTTYTEVDLSGVLTVTSPKVVAVNCTRDIDAYVYKDFGVNYFNGFSVDFEVYQDNLTGSGGSVIAPGFTVSAVGDYTDFGFWDIAVNVNQVVTRRITLRRGYLQAADYFEISDDTLYYCTLERLTNSDTVTVKIYDDSGRTNLLDTLSVSGFGIARRWRYCYGFTSNNAGLGGRRWDGYVQNMEITITTPPFIPKIMMF